MELPERGAIPKIKIKINKENGLEFKLQKKIDILNKTSIEINMEKLAGVFSQSTPGKMAPSELSPIVIIIWAVRIIEP